MPEQGRAIACHGEVLRAVAVSAILSPVVAR